MLADFDERGDTIIIRPVWASGTAGGAPDLLRRLARHLRPWHAEVIVRLDGFLRVGADERCLLGQVRRHVTEVLRRRYREVERDEDLPAAVDPAATAARTQPLDPTGRGPAREEAPDHSVIDTATIDRLRLAADRLLDAAEDGEPMPDVPWVEPARRGAAFQAAHIAIERGLAIRQARLLVVAAVFPGARGPHVLETLGEGALLGLLEEAGREAAVSSA